VLPSKKKKKNVSMAGTSVIRVGAVLLCINDPKI